MRRMRCVPTAAALHPLLTRTHASHVGLRSSPKAVLVLSVLLVFIGVGRPPHLLNCDAAAGSLTFPVQLVVPVVDPKKSDFPQPDHEFEECSDVYVSPAGSAGSPTAVCHLLPADGEAADKVFVCLSGHALIGCGDDSDCRKFHNRTWCATAVCHPGTQRDVAAGQGRPLKVCVAANSWQGAYLQGQRNIQKTLYIAIGCIVTAIVVMALLWALRNVFGVCERRSPSRRARIPTEQETEFCEQQVALTDTGMHRKVLPTSEGHSLFCEEALPPPPPYVDPPPYSTIVRAT